MLACLDTRGRCRKKSGKKSKLYKKNDVRRLLVRAGKKIQICFVKTTQKKNGSDGGLFACLEDNFDPN